MLLGASLLPASARLSAQSMPRDPLGAAAWRDEAQRRYASGNLEGSLAALQRAIQRDSGDAQLHFMEGNALFRLGRFRPAARAYAAAAALRPDHPDTWVGLGFARYYDGSVDSAVAAWETAVRTSPRSAIGRLALAVGYSCQGQAYFATLQRQLAEEQQPDCDMRWTLRRDIRWKASAIARLQRIPRIRAPERGPLP